MSFGGISWRVIIISQIDADDKWKKHFSSVHVTEHSRPHYWFDWHIYKLFAWRHFVFAFLHIEPAVCLLTELSRQYCIFIILFIIDIYIFTRIFIKCPLGAVLFLTFYIEPAFFYIPSFCRRHSMTNSILSIKAIMNHRTPLCRSSMRSSFYCDTIDNR